MSRSGRTGIDSSSLISTVKKASEADFIRARRWYRCIRTGDLERILRDALSTVQPEQSATLTPLLEITRFQREVSHVVRSLLCTFLPIFSSRPSRSNYWKQKSRRAIDN